MPIMDESRAREILKKGKHIYPVKDGTGREVLYFGGIYYYPGDSMCDIRVCLAADELEAIFWWMKNKK